MINFKKMLVEMSKIIWNLPIREPITCITAILNNVPGHNLSKANMLRGPPKLAKVL